MNVPGLSGRWQDRNRQLYEKLGSPMGAYMGNLQQNLYLLDQIRKNNYFRGGLPGQAKKAPAPKPKATAPAPVAPRPVVEAQQAAEAAPQLDFKKDVMPWEQFFDENLALSSAAQRAGGYYTPLLQRGRENVESDFASRGLTRSSQRGRSVMDLYKDMADQEQKMRDQLYGQVEKEAKENYGYQQSLYEEDPRGYKKNTYEQEPYEYDYPVESPGKYGQSYRDWLRTTFKI